MDQMDYFVERTDSRLEQIENKIDSLLAFKFLILGGSGVVTVMINLLFLFFEYKLK